MNANRNDMSRGTTAPTTRVRGFSLVEVMVAMAIGLVIVLAVVQVFSHSRSTYQLDEGLARVQENARFALEFLTREIRPAGNMGCVRDDFREYNNLDTSGTNGIFTLFRQGVLGFEYTGTGPGQTYTESVEEPADTSTGWAPTLASAGLIPDAQPGTDAIVVFHLSDRPYEIDKTNPWSNAQIFLAPHSGESLKEGDIAIISSCAQAEYSIFQVTGVNASGVNIQHAASGTPGNACPAWNQPPNCPPGTQQYGNDAEINRVQMVAFYIKQSAASGRPALVMRSLVTGSGSSSTLTAQELVDGVENMQILYGVDDSTSTRMDGEPDQYLTAAQIAAMATPPWDRVVSVRVALLMSTSQSTGSAAETIKDTNTYLLNGVDAGTASTIDPFDDFRRRRVFSTTISLRNRGI